MLNSNNTPSSVWSSVAKMVNVPILIAISIALGSLIGHKSLIKSEWISAGTDITILVLVALLFFNIRFDKVLKTREHLRFLVIAILANFLIVPVIGYAIATFVAADYQLFMVGLMIYFMAPCTDWFLAFTRIVNGNTLVGSVLMPLNMIIQLLLYPLFLYLFTKNSVVLEDGLLLNTLLDWFLKPLAIALVARIVLQWLLSSNIFETLMELTNKLIPIIIALLVMQIFASNISVLIENKGIFGWALLAVFSFFVVTLLLSELISKVFKLEYPEYALLTITIAARNAPLMLAITMAVLPNQPVIYASIVIAMLLEFPHLTLLTFFLKRKSARLNG